MLTDECATGGIRVSGSACAIVIAGGQRVARSGDAGTAVL